MTYPEALDEVQAITAGFPPQKVEAYPWTLMAKLLQVGVITRGDIADVVVRASQLSEEA